MEKPVTYSTSQLLGSNGQGDLIPYADTILGGHVAQPLDHRQHDA